jgi:Cdc6-like AAA superfamily ATPase
MAELTDSCCHSLDEVFQVSHWLSPIDASAQLRDYLAKRTRGTGTWLLQSQEFQEWIGNSSKGNIIWLTGNLGVGKSTLCACVIDHLTSTFSMNDVFGLAFFYPEFATRGGSMSQDLFSVLLKQLVLSKDTLPNSLKSLHETYSERNDRPSSKDLWNMIKSVIRSYSRVFVVIDSLDEIVTSPQDREYILDAILYLQKEDNVHLFVTQRCKEEIPCPMRGMISIRAHAHPDDLTLYLVPHLPGLKMQPGGSSDLLTDILKAVDGV